MAFTTAELLGTILSAIALLISIITLKAHIKGLKIKQNQANEAIEDTINSIKDDLARKEYAYSILIDTDNYPLNSKKIEEAVRKINSILKKDKKNIKALYYSGILNIHTNNLQGAFSKFEEIKKINKKRPEPYNGLGLVNAKFANDKKLDHETRSMFYKKAIQNYLSAIKISKKNKPNETANQNLSIYLHNTGNAYLNIKETDIARDYFKQAIQIDSRNLYAKIGIANTYYIEDKYKDALINYNELLKQYTIPQKEEDKIKRIIDFLNKQINKNHTQSIIRKITTNKNTPSNNKRITNQNKPTIPKEAQSNNYKHTPQINTTLSHLTKEIFSQNEIDKILSESDIIKNLKYQNKPSPPKPGDHGMIVD